MWMRLEVQLPPAPIGYVRVQLRRGKVGVAEHLLHRAQIRPALEQVRRERVPEEMRVDAFGLEARLRRQPPEDQERPGARQRASLGVEEELRPVASVEVRTAPAEVAP